MSNFWIFPDDANHNAFYDLVDAALRKARREPLPQAAYSTAYEVRFSNLTPPQELYVNMFARDLGWRVERD